MTDGCKLGIVADRYGLDDAETRFESLDDHLVARWTGEGKFQAQGYRSLATWFNKRLLKQVYDRNDRSTLGSRIDDEFSTLTGEDDLAREELIDDLAQDGIDGERIHEDMVSWSTVRTHLQRCLEAEKPTESAETNWEERSVDFSKDILQEKVSDALTSYQNKGWIADATDADVSVQIHLACPECPTRVSLDEALDRGYVCERHGTGAE